MPKRPTEASTTRKSAAAKPSSRSSSTKATSSRSRKTVKPATSAPMQARRGKQTTTVAAPSAEAIAARAYELFEARGGAHGHDADDWFRAEAELRAVV